MASIYEMNLDVKKKIGDGTASTVYLVEFNKTPCIMKVEKYDGDVSNKSSFGREIEFAKVASKYPKFFTKLLYYGIIPDCAKKFPIPYWAKGQFKKQLIENNKMKQCRIMVYSPVMDYTWEHRPRLTNGQYYLAVKQLVECVDILRKHGFAHTDIHLENIMYGKGRWVLIDYGAINHKMFQKSQTDLTRKPYTIDILQLLWAMSNNDLFWYIQKKKLPLELNYKKIMSDERYTNMKQYLPKTTDNDIKKECISLVCLTLHYDLYVEALGYDPKKYSKYMSKQVNNDLFLYIIKHSCDKNYSLILKYLEKLI
jgi:serine/threonine protein kinase